jgi:hypothetical protein
MEFVRGHGVRVQAFGEALAHTSLKKSYLAMV